MAVKICSDPEPFVENIYTFPTGAIYKCLSFFLPLSVIFQPLSQLESTIILNITVYATSLCKWRGQFQWPSGSSFSMKMKMSFCFFYAIYHFPAYTILKAIFLEQKNHTHWKWRCWISTLGIFFKWLEKIVFVLNMYCYWFSSTT